VSFGVVPWKVDKKKTVVAFTDKNPYFVGRCDRIVTVTTQVGGMKQDDTHENTGSGCRSLRLKKRSATRTQYLGNFSHWNQILEI
jgi:hypothetical protein